MSSVNSLPPEMQDLMVLGTRLGQNFAYGTVGGRCAAAQAAALRDIREGKLYKRFTPHWSVFCRTVLKMSKTQADLLIRLLEQYGPAYFEIQQLTRITPEIYRIIQPSIKDGKLHFDGEVIELIEENAEKVASVVADVRASLPKPPDAPPPSIPELLAAVARRYDAVIDEFLSIAKKDGAGDHRELALGQLERFRSRLGQLDLAGTTAA